MFINRFGLRNIGFFDIGNDNEYFNDNSETDLNNRRIIDKVANKSYRPTNQILQDLLDHHPDFDLPYHFRELFWISLKLTPLMFSNHFKSWLVVVEWKS